MLESSKVVRSGADVQRKRGPLGISKISQVRIARITEYINEKGTASAGELSAVLNLDAGTMSRYLRHMCDAGLVHLVQRRSYNPANPRPALYGLGDLEEEVDGWAEMPPVVRTLASWPGGTASRDPLVAALFGPANFSFRLMTSTNQIRV